jgi:hypothetical protein
MNSSRSCIARQWGGGGPWQSLNVQKYIYDKEHLFTSACLRFFFAANEPKSAVLKHQTRLDDSVARLLRKGFRGF